MTKVSIIGAGSAVFATSLMRDILCTPALESGTFALVDIDPRRLELAHGMAELLIAQSGRNWNVVASTERTTVISDSDFVINSIEVAGLANVRPDYDIPLRYGVDQCIGDTSGPGGLFKALRTVPAWLDILQDVEVYAPNATVLNYTNPMSIMVLAAAWFTDLPVVGLCHSVQGTSRQLAGYLDIPYEQLTWQVGGINHLAWFTTLEHGGQDMYPRLRERIQDPAIYEQDPVRFDMMEQFGAFITESSGHLSEYLPYYRKRPELLQRYMRAGYLGESGFYANNWPTWRNDMDARIGRYLAGEEAYEMHRGHEYASQIIEAMETNKPAVIYGNVYNSGLISNLPQDGVVEVACLVDGRGIQPTHFGPLPTQMAAIDAQHMAFHDLVATAILEEDREAAVHALMIDPLTAAVCSPREIRAMFDEMAAAERDYLPAFLQA